MKFPQAAAHCIRVLGPIDVTDVVLECGEARVSFRRQDGRSGTIIIESRGGEECEPTTIRFHTPFNDAFTWDSGRFHYLGSDESLRMATEDTYAGLILDE